MNRSFTTGGVLRRTFTVFFSEAPSLLAIAAIVYSPLVVLTVGLVVYFLGQPGWGLETAGGVDGTVSFSTNGLFQQLAAGGSVLLIFRRLRDEDVELGTSLRTGFSRFFALIGLALLVGVAVAVGTLMCVVPGLYLECALFVATPVLVVESTGVWDAFNRSFSLTEDYRWTVFGVVAVFAGLGLAVSLVWQTLAIQALDGLVLLVTSITLTFAVTILFTCLNAVAAVIVYHDLRLHKEGLEEDELVAVFE